jgi:hypothetical protein
MRILERFPRRELEGFILVAIELLDTLDGDPEAEDGTDLEDDFALTPNAELSGEGAPGCPIADAHDPSWIEWNKRGRNKLRTVEQAALNAGLQLADTVASSFYQAANSVAPNFDIRPACALSPIMPCRHGVAANYAVTLFPLEHQAKVPEAARPVFTHYGYTF